MTRLPAVGRPVSRPPPRPASAGRHRPRSQLAWAELHCHSSYSFLDGASSPEELVAEAAERGLAALAITDHDGMYGVPQFAQAAARLPGERRSRARHGLRRRAQPDLSLPGSRPEPGGPRPGRPPPAGARPRPGGLRAAVPGHQRRAARRGEKGRPVYDQAALAEAHDGHWVILTGCRKGAVPAAPRHPRQGRRRPPDPGPAGPQARSSPAPWPTRGPRPRELRTLTDVRRAERQGRADHRRPATDDERNDALSELAAAAGAGHDRDQQRALRRAPRRPAGPGAGGDPGAQQPG